MITIGNWNITKLKNGKFWISDERSGEGGEFLEEKVAEIIENFFVENF